MALALALCDWAGYYIARPGLEERNIIMGSHTSAGNSISAKPGGENKKRIALISTGGTIEKTYNESDGAMYNHLSVLDVMLASLQIKGIHVNRVSLMNKDSLQMTEADHRQIAEVAGIHAQYHDGVIVVHGTDRLTRTGEEMCKVLGTPKSPIVLTGAMRPYELRSTDALQNLTESLLAVQILSPGIYVVMHNKVLQFPGVFKDYQERTFKAYSEEQLAAIEAEKTNYE